MEERLRMEIGFRREKLRLLPIQKWTPYLERANITELAAGQLPKKENSDIW
jgi:hypothetical protein